MTDFVEALEAELRGAAERRARGGKSRSSWRWRPSRLLPVAAIAVALGIGLALVLAVRPGGEERTPPAATVNAGTAPREGTRTAAPDLVAPAAARPVPPAEAPPADISPGARRSKRFGLGSRVATSDGVPVYADVSRWRYCPRDPRRLSKGDVPAAVGAVLAMTGWLTDLDTVGARGQGSLVTRGGYAVHQCGSLMRNRSIDVFVRLPAVKNSASLAQLDLVVARTPAGWIVFDRRH